MRRMPAAASLGRDGPAPRTSIPRATPPRWRAMSWPAVSVQRLVPRYRAQRRHAGAPCPGRPFRSRPQLLAHRLSRAGAVVAVAEADDLPARDHEGFGAARLGARLE